MDLWARLAAAIVAAFISILIWYFVSVVVAIWPEILTEHIYPAMERMSDRLHDFSERLNNREAEKRAQDEINFKIWRAKMAGAKLPTIKTYCEKCAALYGVSYKVKKLGFKTTTEMKKKCEHCGKTGRFILAQYLVDKKSGES